MKEIKRAKIHGVLSRFYTRDPSRSNHGSEKEDSSQEQFRAHNEDIYTMTSSCLLPRQLVQALIRVVSSVLSEVRVKVYKQLVDTNDMKASRVNITVPQCLSIDPLVCCITWCRQMRQQCRLSCSRIPFPSPTLLFPLISFQNQLIFNTQVYRQPRLFEFVTFQVRQTDIYAPTNNV